MLQAIRWCDLMPRATYMLPLSVLTATSISLIALWTQLFMWPSTTTRLVLPREQALQTRLGTHPTSHMREPPLWIVGRLDSLSLVQPGLLVTSRIRNGWRLTRTQPAL